MEYKFESGQDEKIPANEAIIVKKGIEIKFSFNELLANKASFEKTLKELKGNRELKAGIIKNMDEHHPFIKDMPEFDRYAVHMYQEAYVGMQAYDKKIAEIEKDFEEYNAEVEDIKAQIPVLADVISPIQPIIESEEVIPAPEVSPIGEEPVEEEAKENGEENKEN